MTLHGITASKGPTETVFLHQLNVEGLTTLAKVLIHATVLSEETVVPEPYDKDVCHHGCKRLMVPRFIKQHNVW
jgi:hypothetical protein